MILQKPGAKDPKAECQSVPFHVIGVVLASLQSRANFFSFIFFKDILLLLVITIFVFLLLNLNCILKHSILGRRASSSGLANRTSPWHPVIQVLPGGRRWTSQENQK